MMTDNLLERWDAQQAGYIAHREQRFTVMLEVLELALGNDPTVVDLGCGPGSLGLRVLERLPGSQVIAIDHDPVLMAIARQALAPFADRARVVDADLCTPSWPSVLSGEQPNAMVSSTALHWLFPSQLVAVYRQVAELLPEGGVFLNADHFRFDDRAPTLKRIAALHDTRTQEHATAAGAESWNIWWEAAKAHPVLAELVTERERRYADRGAPPTTAIDFHLAALAQAGFREAGPVWQYLDDYVVFARR